MKYTFSNVSYWHGADVGHYLQNWKMTTESVAFQTECWPDGGGSAKTCTGVILSEPTSGAGGMVIAFEEVMLARGLNPAE